MLHQKGSKRANFFIECLSQSEKMQRLPSELLEEVSRHLTASDVASLRKTARDTSDFVWPQRRAALVRLQTHTPNGRRATCAAPGCGRDCVPIVMWSKHDESRATVLHVTHMDPTVFV